MFTCATRPLRRPAVAALAALVACLLAAGPAEATEAGRCPGALDVPSSPQELSAAADAVTCLVNAERTSRGLKPLQRDGDLAQAARRHAADMVRRAYFAHVTPSGSDLGDRVDYAGYGDPGDGWRIGENLGWGTGPRGTPAWLVDAWLASPHHRRILLEPAFRELGAGAAQGAPKATDGSLPGATYTLELGVIRPG